MINRAIVQGQWQRQPQIEDSLWQLSSIGTSFFCCCCCVCALFLLVLEVFNCNRKVLPETIYKALSTLPTRGGGFHFYRESINEGKRIHRSIEIEIERAHSPRSLTRIGSGQHPKKTLQAWHVIELKLIKIPTIV